MFHRMRIYSVHVKPGDTGADFRPRFIKEGFNWAAFIFTFFWALYQRLWVVALGLVLLEFLLMNLLQAHILTRFSVAVIHLGIHAFVGMQANDWLRARLARQGYIVSDITAADSFLRAQQRYLERYVAASG